MAQTDTAARSLSDTLDRLAELPPSEAPIVSLYLDARADPHGKDHWAPFVRKELHARVRTFPPRSPARESLDRDVVAIERYLANDLSPSANGLVLFASSAAGLFEAVPLAAGMEENRLSVSSYPHLYPLARLIDEYPRYAVVVADTHSARIFVFGRGRRIDLRRVEGTKIHKTDVGGWSQLRYQRHVEEVRQHNAQEIVSALEETVRRDRAEHVILAGDEEILPMLRRHLTSDLSARVIDVLRLSADAPDRQILEASMAALRAWDAKSDAERVARALDEYRAGGLAVIGPEAVQAALAVGQVDELLLSATLAPPSDVTVSIGSPGVANAPERAPEEEGFRLTAEFADELVRVARQTSARVTFIEDSKLLEECSGVAALLRYRFTGTGLEKNP